jgi:hypothetical protein
MDTLAALRRLIAGILLLGMSGTFVELLLLQHDEDTLQLLPLVLLGSGLAVVAWHVWSRSFTSGTAVRLVMVLFVASGLLGIYFHYDANVAFQREGEPTLAGMELLSRVLRAKVPPALAPGIMVQLGLLGLAYTYRLKER